jgi:hypothetical protein
MALSIADAYAQIKNLENSGQITLPEPQATVEIGTIDPKAGTFTWSAPTVVQTTTLPPLPGQRTNNITKITVGVVATTAVDLRLKFAVIPQRTQPENSPVVLSAAVTPSASPGAVATLAIPAMAAGSSAASSSSSTRVPSAAGTAAETLLATSTLLETNGGVTISGFPTAYSQANEIIVDAALACSSVNQPWQDITPRISNFGMTVNIPGQQPIDVFVFILRPPVIGMGAFTIPALPMTIVYAPPQGKLLKNTATYADTDTFTRTVTTAITSNNSTKTVEAYSVADLIGKVTAAIAIVVAVVGTGGTAAVAAPTVLGALQELGAALVGPAKDANDSTASATQAVSADLSLVAGILNAVDNTIPTDTSAVQLETDHSLTLSVSNMSQYSSESGLGPGVGDRIVYLSNVKVVWMAVNGDVGIHILGYDGVAANGVQDLLQEQKSISNGGNPTLGLDAATIASLLNLDPLAPRKPTVASGARIEPPLIGPPRFVPADPPGRKGTGTGSTPDTFQAVVDTTVEDKQVTSNTQSTVTDFKPGWVSVLFGADDSETTTTTTLTNSQTVDIKTDDRIVSTITFVSEGLEDPYDVKIFKDFTFGSYVIVDSNSPALQGGTAVIEMEPAKLS